MDKHETRGADRRGGQGRRDRRDAGAPRLNARAIERRRDLDKSAERALKSSSSGRSCSAGSIGCLPSWAAAGRDGAGSERPSPRTPGTGRTGGVAGQGPSPSNGARAPSVAQSVAGAQPSWLPPAGRTVLVGGMRISAIPVADAPGAPFYVITGRS